ncbi:HVO_0234 family beta-propeller protein [Halegenticoccus tardaugens]|uniref:HVO_0234 family beta-propeller protein n=1 Tax=Halegenticoccus tardaugens TaxID=2071624 RepID=UPI00100AAF8F|nr:hypothetical protein [Halegenticoccus tardaugens]
MSTIDEKRVYGDKAGKVEAFVATAIGVVVVEVSGDQIGGFGVERRCDARDVAAAGGEVAVATDEDVFVDGRGDENDGDGADRDDDPEDADAFEETGFGPAVAVGYDGRSLLAAGEDGRVSRRARATGTAGDGESGGGDWIDLGVVEDVRAIDGPLVAAAEGVHRIGGDGLERAGLRDVRDVAGRGVPLAATAEGLYALGNGWMKELDGDVRVVSSDGRARAHAVADGSVHARADGGWEAIDPPIDEPVAAIDYAADATIAVTATGTFLVDAGDGWRSQALGLGEIAGLAVR